MNKKELISSIRRKGFSEKIIRAFKKVPRENFVPEFLKPKAYEDIALPISYGQTISQPYTIAMMLSLLEVRKNQKVLEIGSGCGYMLSLISQLVGESGKVFGIEIIKELADKSKINLRNYKNVKVYNKDGADGLDKHTPFKRILISAALEEIPEKLIEQLSDKGILVAPVGGSQLQSLKKYQKIRNKLILKEQIPGFVFVKFV